MDIIEFKPSITLPDRIDIFINGRNLIEIVREVELPFAKGFSNLAGDYVGLHRVIALWPSTHLLGKPIGNGGLGDERNEVCGA